MGLRRQGPRSRRGLPDGVLELALLAGAAGFTAESRTAKTRADLNALLYADGIHDSLYRTAGRRHASPAQSAIPETALALVPAMRAEQDGLLASA